MIEPRDANAGDVPAIAALHGQRLADGFLATLGPRFLERLYARMVESSNAHVFVVDDGGRLAGFIATANDTSRFYREFLRHDAIAAAAGSARAMFRAPRQVWETLRYGTGGGRELPPAEVLAVAVVSDASARGVGAALVARATAQFRADGVGAARVVTVVDNDAALRMYERAGFRRHSRTEVHAGIAQQVLVWP